MTERAGLYVDGFNLYHAVDELGDAFLKWCNLWRLGEIIIPSRTERLVRVVFCTAFYPGDSGKRIRHERYIAALKRVGVECVLGHYVHEDMSCRGCRRDWKKPTEKETDINVALSLYDDAACDLIDHAYLLTADSDQAASARMFRHRYSEKKLTTVSPPGRNFSKHILNYTEGRKIALNRDHIERSHFGNELLENGPPIVRPLEYAPPQGWMHPDQLRAQANPANETQQPS